MKILLMNGFSQNKDKAVLNTKNCFRGEQVSSLPGFRGQLLTKMTTDTWIKNGTSGTDVQKTFTEDLQQYKGNIEVVFSDIDGTLSESDDEVTVATVKAADALAAKNIPLILTTARTYKDTLPILEQFNQKPLYTIVLQGGSIYDEDGNAIVENRISEEDGKSLIAWYEEAFARDKNAHLILYFDDDPYSVSDIQYPWKARKQITKVDNYSELFEEKVLQKAVVFKPNAQVADEKPIVSSFKDFGIENLAIKPSSVSVFEIQNADVAKDKSIDYILACLNIQPQNTMVIGDSSNDIEMLDFIKAHGGLAVAMGNSSDSVKQHAGVVTAGVQDDGFAEVVKNIL